MATRDNVMPTVVFHFEAEPKKEGISYNMTSRELKEVIEQNPEAILKVVKILRDFKDNDWMEFDDWWNKLKIDPALKKKAGEEIKNALVHNLDALVAKALGIVVKYNIPPRIFRYEGAIYKEIYVDPNRCELRNRTPKESLEDIKSILSDSGWNSIPKSVVHAVVNGIYGIPKLNGITSKPIVREDGSIITKQGFDKESKLYYQPSYEESIERFLRKWLKVFGDKGIYAKDIVEWINSKPEMQLPKVISDTMENSNQAIALGRALKELQKVKHNSLRLVMTKDKHTKANMYKVKSI